MTEHVFVDSLPDLIQPEEYSGDPHGRLVRVRITVDDQGVTVLGDAVRPATVDRLLGEVGGGPVEQMLCG
jgi:hypothetical protein